MGEALTLQVGTQKQLFIDDRFFARSDGVRLRMNPPVQHPEPVLTADRPWEPLGIGGYNTVMREADGRFRCWYDAGLKGGLPSEGARRLCYAESADGLHWDKPSLGLVEFRGTRDTNIVAPLQERQSQQGACVLRDARAPAAERYKLWTKFQPTDTQISQGVRPGLWAMYSADGLAWQPYSDQPNPPDAMCDTQNTVFWDDRLDLYVGYTRSARTQRRAEAAEAGSERNVDGTGRYRAVERITSPDFRTWSEPRITFEADSDDLAIPVPAQRDDPRPNIDIYTSCAMQYPGAQDAYVMLPALFYHWDDDDFPATMDVQLLTSRDGVSWRRCGGRGPFLRCGPDGSATSGRIFANPWLIPMGDQLWLYYSGTGRTHSERKSPAADTGIFRASLRLDGFVSADAGYGGGEFTTPPLTFEGDRLELNLDGSAGGWLKIEIQDAQGRALSGFGLTEADAVRGNSTAKSVSWRGSGNLTEITDVPVKLRFVMRDIKLYAFQFGREQTARRAR